MTPVMVPQHLKDTILNTQLPTVSLDLLISPQILKAAWVMCINQLNTPFRPPSSASILATADLAKQDVGLNT